MKIFSSYFKEITNNKSENVWLLSHKPIWVVPDSNQKIKPFSTLQKSIEKNIPAQLQLVFSGHVHRFQVLNSSNNRPAQVITGNSGSRLDAAFIETLLQSFLLANGKLHQDISFDQFGFLVLEKTDNHWVAQAYDVNGTIKAHCNLDKKQLRCLMP